jgi:hypothetical protein
MMPRYRVVNGSSIDDAGFDSAAVFTSSSARGAAVWTA